MYLYNLHKNEKMRKHLGEAKIVRKKLKVTPYYSTFQSHFSVSQRQAVLSLLVICTCFVYTRALFKDCDHEYQIFEGITFEQSTGYPSYHPQKTPCRYKFTAPMDYRIAINCTIDVYKPRENECGSDIFYIDYDGDSSLANAERFCGPRTIYRYATFESVVVAYISNGEWGRFTCAFNVQKTPCKCGRYLYPKVTHGEEAQIFEFPSMVALKDKTTNMLICGGTIITHQYILSAGHCVQPHLTADKMVAHVGGDDLTSKTKNSAQYQIIKIIVHPDFISNPLKNDIAFYKTSTNIKWSRVVSPICLPPNANNNYADTNVIAFGWGRTSFKGQTSSKLLKIPLKILKNQECASKYIGTAPIYDSHICMYDSFNKSRHTCVGDSGGPVCMYVEAGQMLIGTISFNMQCGERGNPINVNERITWHLEWIHQITENAACSAGI